VRETTYGITGSGLVFETINRKTTSTQLVALLAGLRKGRYGLLKHAALVRIEFRNASVMNLGVIGWIGIVIVEWLE